MKPKRQPVSFIATDRPDQSRAFFAEVVGLELVERTPFALVFRDHNHTLRVQIVSELTPAPYTAYGWQVSDITTEIQELTRKGVAFNRFDGLAQDETGVWTSPDGHKIAWFCDPSGNTLSVTQYAEP